MVDEVVVPEPLRDVVLLMSAGRAAVFGSNVEVLAVAWGGSAADVVERAVREAANRLDGGS